MFRSTLEQWFVLQCVIEQGGFTAAAKFLHKSQSSVSYTITKLQEQLGVTLVIVQGKTVALTPIGKSLLEDVRPFLNELKNIEYRAKVLAAGAEVSIRIEVDSIYPKHFLFKALKCFKKKFPETQVALQDVIRLTPQNNNDPIDLSIAFPFNTNLLGKKLLDVELLAVAHPNHPLHQLDKSHLTASDLNLFTQVHIENSQSADEHPLPSRKVWRVNTVHTAIAAVASQLCFGWLPKHEIEHLLNTRQLKALPLTIGQIRKIPLTLIYNDFSQAGPATRELGNILIEQHEN
ncbi:LysR family transcriptional regulator [Zooshikella harenae]|uniref:LysR family transcriptional regulator n=1 Tax=Zooshikella harenae TaxID=2827238 RepID=A0ABS5ZFT6_9GAMM|nr:LysR family transcriptional regulator [Zooshikella harenae]MBU2712874.1 LysR family transcriptional regulator [Zooshikella harenae]